MANIGNILLVPRREWGAGQWLSVASLSASVHMDAAHRSTFPEARRYGYVPNPSTPTPTYTETPSNIEVLWCNDDGDTLFGGATTKLYKSVDYGANWTELATFAQNVNAVRQLANGELIVAIDRDIAGSLPGKLYKSAGYPTLGASATWSLVLTAGGVQARFTNAWSLSSYMHIAVAAEYGSYEHARRVYASQDYGATWSEVFDLGAIADGHVHGAVYDRFWDRVWVVTGDSANRSIQYCDDWRTNKTWTTVSSGLNSMQIVSILPMEHCVLFLTDSWPDGVVRIWRTRREVTPVVEQAYTIDNSESLAAIGMLPYWREGSPALLPFIRSTTGQGILLATWDGTDVFEVWREDRGTYNTPYGLNSAFPMDNGTIVGTISSDISGSPHTLTLTTPDFIRAERLLPYFGIDRYLRVYNNASSGCFCVNAASLNITGDLDIRVKVAADDPTPAAASDLMSKYIGADGSRGYRFYLNTTGVLRLYWTTDGNSGTAVTASSTEAPTSILPGVPIWLRATLDVDNGSGAYEVKFYESTDDAATWDQIGTTVTGGSTTSVFAATAPGLAVGGSGVNGEANHFEGEIYTAELRSGIAGTIVASPDFTDEAWEVNSRTASPKTYSRKDNQGNSWIISGLTRIYSKMRIRQPRTSLTIPTVTGARADGTALANLLAALDDMGLITDSST